MSAAETYARFLIEPYSEEEKVIFLDLWRTRPYEMIDILNTHFYVKDASKVYLVLDTASQLGLSYMDICQVLSKTSLNV